MYGFENMLALYQYKDARSSDMKSLQSSRKFTPFLKRSTGYAVEGLYIPKYQMKTSFTVTKFYHE